MKQLRAVYPEKSVYTQQVGPGCCFGALALMLRFYFEVTDLRIKKTPTVRQKSRPLLTPSPLSIGPVSCLDPTGVGLRLRAQLLPPVAGRVLRAAAA